MKRKTNPLVTVSVAAFITSLVLVTLLVAAITWFEFSGTTDRAIEAAASYINGY